MSVTRTTDRPVEIDSRAVEERQSLGPRPRNAHTTPLPSPRSRTRTKLAYELVGRGVNAGARRARQLAGARARMRRALTDVRLG
jgi:hypothetical protein